MKIIHKTPTRIRVKFDEISDKFQEADLQNQILALKGVKSVRINARIKCAIIECENTDEVALNLDEISPKPLAPDQMSCFCTHAQEVTKAQIVSAGGSLLMTKFSRNNFFHLTHTLFSAYPVIFGGIKELFSQGLTSRTLEAMAISASILQRDYVAANSTNLMVNLGEYIEETMVNKSDELIKELAKPTIKEVWVEREISDKTELVKLSQEDVKFGDIVVVSTGETIGIDGYIVDGVASVNQVSMTGEAAPVKKERGDRVMSGTIVEDGVIKIWAELIGADTSTEKIKHYIQNSLNEKSAIGMKATKMADKLVPITLGLSGAAYLINKNLTSVASVLQADYSCALKLATPVAFKSAIAKAGKNGILIKGSKSIEALAKIDTVIFDKTGTLSHGNMEIVDIISFDDEWDKNQILNLAASAEEHYFHPIAEAIVEAAKKIGFKHIHHDKVEYVVAHGIKTTSKDKKVLIGSRHFIEDDEQISFEKHKEKIQNLLDLGDTLLYIAYDKKLLGVIVLNDDIRENAKVAIERLRNLGIKQIIMLTGDTHSKAAACAKRLGVDKFYADLEPTQKADIIQSLKDAGNKVAFVGDGINDAPSLVKADVGISMQRGADIAKLSADIALLRDDIECVADAKELSNKTLALVYQNFNLAVWINSAIILSATLGKLSPTATAFLHNGTTIGLLLNSIKGVKFNANER